MTMPARRWLTGACLPALLAGCVLAPPQAPTQTSRQPGGQRQTVVIGTVSGTRQPVRGVQALDTDCEQLAPATGRVLEPPEHGVITFAAINQIVVAGRRLYLGQCRNGNDPTLMSYYQSAAGYRGPDRTVIEMTVPPMPPQSFTVLIDVK
jgi:hypothetical protein